MNAKAKLPEHYTPAQIAQELVDLEIGETFRFGSLEVTKGVEYPGELQAKYVYLICEYPGRHAPLTWYFGGAFRSLCEEGLRLAFGKTTVGNWLNGN